MEKKISLGKRAKISQAQQYMILAVLGAGIFLGMAIAVVTKSIDKISFNASVVMAEDESIVAFSNAIKDIGICPAPSGDVYTDSELEKCAPDSVSASDVPGTLRSNILEELASSAALESVADRSGAGCTNPETGNGYTYKELEAKYDSAETDKELNSASALIKSCSALRVIPDALPAYKNEEALLASVDKIFRVSGTEPEALSPSDETDVADYGTKLYTIAVTLSIGSDTSTVHSLLGNFERSIRNFNIDRATISWSSSDSIEFQANATAYFMLPTNLSIEGKTIKKGATVVETTDTEETDVEEE